MPLYVKKKNGHFGVKSEKNSGKIEVCLVQYVRPKTTNIGSPSRVVGTGKVRTPQQPNRHRPRQRAWQMTVADQNPQQRTPGRPEPPRPDPKRQPHHTTPLNNAFLTAYAGHKRHDRSDNRPSTKSPKRPKSLIPLYKVGSLVFITGSRKIRIGIGERTGTAGAIACG